MSMVNFSYEPETNRLALQDIAFLGRGGQKPGLDLYNSLSCSMTSIASLATQQSVYAMNIASGKEMIAVGTRSGKVYQFLPDNKNHYTIAKEWIQGAPIFEVLCIGDHTIAVADAFCRCFLWDLAQHSSCLSMDTQGRTICALLQVGTDILAGLSLDGRLMFWSMDDGRVLDFIEVPNPPVLAPLVKMKYWNANKSMVLPGSEGVFTLYESNSRKRQQIHAHQGDVYGFDIWEDKLISVGRYDGLMKVWAPDSSVPLNNYQINTGAISLGITANNGQQTIIVDDLGNAYGYQYTGKGLTQFKRFNGNNYRSIAAATYEQHRDLIQAQNAAEAIQIVSQLNDPDHSFTENQAKRAHNQLETLGYAHVSEAIKVEAAIKGQDILKALKHSNTLMKLIPKDPSASLSMEKHAQLLIRTGHYKEANEICQRIQLINPDYDFSLQTDLVQELSGKMIHHQYAIEPDLPIKDSILASTLIGTYFSGRYVFSKGRYRTVENLILSLDEIITGVEAIRNKGGEISAPMLNRKKVWWLSSQGVNQVELLFFNKEQNRQIILPALQIAVCVKSVDRDTVIEPILLFEWQRLDEKGVEEANKDAANSLEILLNNHEVKVYTQSVLNDFYFSLQRIITGKNQLKWGVT